MNVEVWHRGASDKHYHLAYTLDLLSVTDEATCELAYFHTKEGSPSQLQEISTRGTTVGDIVCIKNLEGDRCYLLSDISCAQDTPIFEPAALPGKGA